MITRSLYILPRDAMPGCQRGICRRRLRRPCRVCVCVRACVCVCHIWCAGWS